MRIKGKGPRCQLSCIDGATVIRVVPVEDKPSFFEPLECLISDLGHERRRALLFALRAIHGGNRPPTDGSDRPPTDVVGRRWARPWLRPHHPVPFSWVKLSLTSHAIDYLHQAVYNIVLLPSVLGYVTGRGDRRGDPPPKASGWQKPQGSATERRTVGSAVAA